MITGPAGHAVRALSTGALGMALLLATASAAQGRQGADVLADSAAERLTAFYNHPATMRLTGDAHIAGSTLVNGDVAVLGGTLTVDGTIEGAVLVINGDLVASAGARIGAGATVVGGRARLSGEATVAGGVTVYREPLRYRYQDGRLIHTPLDTEHGLSAGRDFPFGRTDLLVASYGAYSRAEGLPIAAGPRVRFTGSHPTTARAMIIARTAARGDFHERFGYDVRAEQLVDAAHGVLLGARLYAEISPIESWGLSSRESALATFFLHRDYRDHYDREGWSMHARLRRPGSPIAFGLEYRDEEHVVAPSVDPLALRFRGDSWRPEPVVGEGALRSLVATLDYDTRNEEADPSAGWLLRADIEQGLGGSLVSAAAIDTAGNLVRQPERTGFLTGHFDLRRYARLSPYARLGIRALAAGSVDGRALPPQRQHALGGEGSLPGYRLFDFDCGARARAVELRGEPFHPYYGCDRIALVQLEYQAGFPFARRIGEAVGLGGSIAHLARWVAFFDAGRAWNERDARGFRTGGSDDFSADAGLGFRFGPLGAYWAVPLSGRSREPNFFIRLGPRF